MGTPIIERGDNDTSTERVTASRRPVLIGVVAAAVAVAAVVVFLVARPSSKPVAASIHVTESNFRIALGAKSAPAGRIRLTVRNIGPAPHELVAFRTDLDETELPMVADGTKVNEDGAGITHIDPEAEDIAAGQSKTVTLDLQPGRYVFICNVVGHYQQGMHDVLTVG